MCSRWRDCLGDLTLRGVCLNRPAERRVCIPIRIQSGNRKEQRSTFHAFGYKDQCVFVGFRINWALPLKLVKSEFKQMLPSFKDDLTSS